VFLINLFLLCVVWYFSFLEIGIGCEKQEFFSEESSVAMFHRWSNSPQQDQESSELHAESKVCWFLFCDVMFCFGEV